MHHKIFNFKKLLEITLYILHIIFCVRLKFLKLKLYNCPQTPYIAILKSQIDRRTPILHFIPISQNIAWVANIFTSVVGVLLWASMYSCCCCFLHSATPASLSVACNSVSMQARPMTLEWVTQHLSFCLYIAGKMQWLYRLLQRDEVIPFLITISSMGEVPLYCADPLSVASHVSKYSFPNVPLF